MKKLLLHCIIIATFICSTCALAQNSTLASKTYAEVTNTIKLLEIASGDENGNMNYDKNVTRAEFTKMVICASSVKDEVVDTNLSVSLFPDVKNTHWGASYISAAINQNLISGYLDGTFRPSNNVKLEEAVTIVLKLLGYTHDDFLSPYPYGQLAKYESLKLNTNISAKQGEYLTRIQCMQLIYNALSTKTKHGSIYCTTLGYKVGSDNIIDYKMLVEAKLQGPYVVTEPNIDSVIGFSAKDATIFKNDKTASFSDILPYDLIYYNKSISTIWAYSDKTFGVIEKLLPNSINPTSAQIGGKNYDFTTNISGIADIKTDDFVMIIFDKSGNICSIFPANYETYTKYHNPDSDFSDIANSTLSEPYVVKDMASWYSDCPFELNDKTQYLFEGRQIVKSNIKENDVLYYSPVFNTVICYRNTVTGIASSIVSTDSSYGGITIMQKTYSFSNQTVKNKFATGGQFGERDSFVTLLLGKDDKIIDAIEGSASHVFENSENSDYLSMIEQTLSAPIAITTKEQLATWQSEIPFDVSNAKVYLNGKSSTAQSVTLNDVLYYSNAFNSVWIYRDSVSGKIEDITPISAPTSIVLSGRTYQIESSKAQYDLSTFGSFSIGDYATLLLGKDGKVSGVVSTESIQSSMVGIVSQTGTKQFKKADGTVYSADIITIISTDNKTYTYEHENRNFSQGDIVTVHFSSGINITKNSKSITSSTAQTLKNSIKNGKFAVDCQMIDYNGKEAIKIYPSRINGIDFDLDNFLYGKLLYCEFDKDNNIQQIIFNNFTGDADKYAVATSVVSQGENTNVEYLLDYSTYTYSVSSAQSINASPICISKNVLGQDKITNLSAYIEVSEITRNAVYTKKGTEYLISDDVQIYLVSVSTTQTDNKSYCICSQIEIGDILSGEYTLHAYYDKLPSDAGRIRVILAYTSY